MAVFLARQLKLQIAPEVLARLPLPVLGLTTPLLPLQREAVLRLASAGRLLLADSPGLGKSLSAIAALRYLKRERSVIICPTHLIGTWLDQFRKHAGGTQGVHVVRGTCPSGIPEGANVVLVGWAILSRWVETLLDWAPRRAGGG